MKLSISNIAWEKNEEREVFSILSHYGVTGIELALTKIWLNLDTITTEEIKIYKAMCKKDNIQIVALQALLFGRPELTIFESTIKRNSTLQYLSRVLEIGSQLGAQVAVFGSPSQRQRFGLSQKLADDISHEFFYSMGKIGQKYGIYFCIEPNPKEYGTDFINTSKQALKLVKSVNHPYFQLHLDTGAMKMNHEDYSYIISISKQYIKHIHISEENLGLIHEGTINHSIIAGALAANHYNCWISIEMRSSSTISNTENIRKTIEFVQREYRI